MIQTYHGGCHCGRVRFELQARLDHVVECNCSICRMRGALWHGSSDAGLRIVKGQEELALYQFNTNTARHYFCRHCGIHPFARPRIAPQAWVVNVRCLDGVDLASLPMRPFDGQHWEAAAAAFLGHGTRAVAGSS
ncbi:MAG: GFA family protein [Pseudomonadota bacterium]